MTVVRMQFKDHTGSRFGKMVVVWPAGLKGKRPRWLCFCDCGKFFTVSSANIYRTKSCGCTRIENFTFLSHGHTRQHIQTPEYHTWANMIQRCSNLDDKYYGGRGIRVCKEWRDSFEIFLADMGPKPLGKTGLRSTYSIERKDVNGNYEPSNCCWATMKEQTKNRRPKKKHV